MNRLLSPLVLLVLGLGLSSCRPEAEKPVPAQPPTEAQQRAKLDQLQLAIGEPVRIDSSAYVLFPLTLSSHVETRESSDGYGSSYESRTNAYWNIIFFNALSGKYHLLDESRKMVIYSYSADESNSGAQAALPTTAAGSAFAQVDDLLYYSVTTEDYNRDGQLNEQDPSYLFVSDKAGRRFQQISPNGFNVGSWERVRGANIVLMRVVRDSNKNRQFDSRDEVVPLVYDLKSRQPAREIFDPEFLLQAKKQLDAQWLKKP